MKLLNILIETHANYTETTLFPWLPESKEKIIIKYDAIPIKYMEKIYIVSLLFPYNYNNIYLQDEESIPSSAEQNVCFPRKNLNLNLIHSSYELNLFLFSCDEYDGIVYNLNDLKYKIPKDKFDDYYFNNDNKFIEIKHMDYYFHNSNAPNLPQLAYLICQADPILIGSVLFNPMIKGIYGILQATNKSHILISALSIKRLFDGINTNFEYSNFYCDYKLFSTNLISGINILSSEYKNILKNETILDVNDLMIIRGMIKYKRIDEYVPIEVYLWYEWIPDTDIILKTYYKGNYYKKQLKFIDYKSILKIPIKHTQSDSKIMRLSYQLLDYFYKKNIILKHERIEKLLLSPYKTNEFMIDVSEELILNKYEEPTIQEINIVS